MTTPTDPHPMTVSTQIRQHDDDGRFYVRLIDASDPDAPDAGIPGWAEATGHRTLSAAQRAAESLLLSYSRQMDDYRRLSAPGGVWSDTP